MENLNCPESNQLKSFLWGELHDEQIDEISEHVEQCRHCEQVMDKLESECTVTLQSNETQVEFEQEDALHAVLKKIKKEANGSGNKQSGPTLPSGTQVGVFRIEGLIGRGGMGQVYAAYHEHLQRRVALKVISSKFSEHLISRKRFQREMQLNGQLMHPNIVQAFDAGESEGLLFLAMEFLEGKDVGEILDKQGTLSVASACEIIRQAALGIQHAHNAGIIHRDIKPSNLFLTRAGVVKVLDMGLARLVDENRNDEITQFGQYVGTINYTSPEQIDPSLQVDHRSDLYALGATLFKMISGSPVYDGRQYDSLINLIHEISSAAPVPIASRLENPPAGLIEIIERLLNKNPDERIQTASELAELIRPYCDSNSLDDIETVTSQKKSIEPSGKTKLIESIPLIDRKKTMLTRLLIPGVITLSFITLISSSSFFSGGSSNKRNVVVSSKGQPKQPIEESVLPETLVKTSTTDQLADGAEGKKGKRSQQNGDRVIKKKHRSAKPAVGSRQGKVVQPFPLAVLGFKDNTKLNAAAGLRSMVNARLEENEELYFVEREELEKVLQEQSLNLSGVVSKNQQIEIGKLTGAKLMLTGSLAQLDETLILSSKLFSTETGRVVSVSVKGKTSDDLADLAEELSEKVFSLVNEQSIKLVPSFAPEKDRIKSLHALLKKRDKPIITVDISEIHIGQPTVDPAAETEFAKYALATGFTIIDLAGKIKTKPDLIVKGEAFSELVGTRGDLVIVKARVEIEVIERKSGKVLAKDRETVVYIDLAEHIAGKSALQKASANLAVRILPALTSE
ncbi:MAG: serine/threonine-protein kinase [Gimesia sp.]